MFAVVPVIIGVAVRLALRRTGGGAATADQQVRRLGGPEEV